MKLREFSGELDAPKLQEFTGALDSGPSWTDNLRDITSALLKIGPTAVKGVADLGRLVTGDRIGVDTSNAMKRGMESFDELIASDAMRAQKAVVNQALQDKNVGITDLPGVVVRNPRAATDGAISSIGSMFLPVGAAVGAARYAPTIAKLFPGTTPVVAATGAAIGTGAAQNAAGVFADTEGEALGDRYIGAAIGGASSLVLGKLLGGGAEGVVARRLAGKIGMRDAMSIVKSAAQTGGKEFLQEAGEESSNYIGKQVAKNEDIDLNAMGKQGLYGGMIGLGVGGASDVATNMPNVGRGRADSQIANAINQAAQDFADVAPPQTVQQTVARIFDRMPERQAMQPAVAPPSLGFDPAVSNPQTTMVADADGNVRALSPDEQLAQQELADRMAGIGLTPDVQRAISMRKQSEQSPLQSAPSPSSIDLINRLMSTGWQPSAISSQGVTPNPDGQLVDAISQDLERLFQEDLKNEIKSRLNLVPVADDIQLDAQPVANTSVGKLTPVADDIRLDTETANVTANVLHPVDSVDLGSGTPNPNTGVANPQGIRDTGRLDLAGSATTQPEVRTAPLTPATARPAADVTPSKPAAKSDSSAATPQGKAQPDARTALVESARQLPKKVAPAIEQEQQAEVKAPTTTSDLDTNSGTDQGQQSSAPEAGAAQSGQKQTKENQENKFGDIASSSEKGNPIDRLPEAVRTNVLAKLKALEKNLDAEKIDAEKYRAGVQDLIGRIQQRNKTKHDSAAIKGIERGSEWVTERLMRAKRKGELSEETVDFALWALAKNPALANDLGISLPEGENSDVAGDYNPASRVIRLFKSNAATTTAVHEILHHTERMMPVEIQNGILKEYQKAWDSAWSKANEKTQKLMQDMLAASAGDAKAKERVMAGFSSGALKYEDHYQLYNASEFWAVNATDILSRRYAVEGSWVAKAKRWLSELVQYMKGALGMRSDAPILKALNAVMEGNGQQITRAMLSESKGVLSDPTNPNIVEDIKRNNNFASSWTVAEPGTADAFVREIQNNKIDLKKVREAIERQYGRLAEEADAYLSEELYHGKVAARIDRLYKDEVEPILAKIAVAGKNANVTVDDVNLYLHARHAPERNAAMKAINPDMKNNESLSGMSDQEASKVMADFTAAGKDKALALIAKDVDQLLSSTRTNIVADGLEDADIVSAWEAAYKHYVPLQRDIKSSVTPKSAGFSLRGPESKRAVGSNKNVVNILANIVAQAETAAIRAEKSIVGRSLLAMARQYPNPDFWSVDKAPTKPRINKSTGLVERDAVDPLYQTADNVIMIKDYDGSHFIVFNKQSERAMATARAMKNLDIAPMNKILEVARKCTRFLASLLTQRNPLFWLTNFSRDVQGAMLNLEGTEAEGLQGQVMSNIPKAFKGMHAIVRGKGAGQWARFANEMQEAGGTTGYMQPFENSDARMKDLRTEVERMQQGKADPRRLARMMLDFVDDYNNIIENAVRLSVFQSARESGVSTAKAASIAKNITVNFNRKGNLTPPINALYMFFNASVQGTARLLQAVTTSKTAQAALGGLAVMGFLMDMLNRMIAGDDDETKRNRYDLIPEFEKSRNWIFMNPMRPGEYVKIPLPLGPHVIHNAGRLMSDAISRKDARNAAEYGWSIAGIFLDAFSPLGASASVGQLIAPSVLDPILQVTENKSFTGAPVYKSGESFGKSDPKPAYTRYFGSTPDIWKGASRMLNDASGGDKDKPGSINIEPDILKHVFYTMTGGPGRTVDQAIDSVVSASKGNDVSINRIPFANRFYGQNDDRQRERVYYDDKKRVMDSKAAFDYYIKLGRRDEANKIASDLGDGDAQKGNKMMREFSSADKNVKKINAQIRKTLEQETPDESSKQEQLRALRKRRVIVMSGANAQEEDE